MADYIKRKDVVNALWKALYSYEDKTEKKFKEDPNLETGEWFDHRIFVQVCQAECLEGVLAIPPADVAEVVRCRDCKYWMRERISCEGLARCATGESGIRYRSENDFCSRGARMDGGT